MAIMSTLTFSIGERVRVNGNGGTTLRRSVVTDIRESVGCPGRILYVLADGGWLDESELDSIDHRYGGRS